MPHGHSTSQSGKTLSILNSHGQVQKVLQPTPSSSYKWKAYARQCNETAATHKPVSVGAYTQRIQHACVNMWVLLLASSTVTKIGRMRPLVCHIPPCLLTTA